MSQSDRSFGTLLTETVDDFSNLVRAQIDLAVSELKRSAKHALLSSIMLIAALGILLITVLLLIIALGFGIAAFGVPYWLAFLIDAGIFFAIAIVLLFIAKWNASRVKAPTMAADNLQKSIHDITAQVSGADD